MLNFTRLKLAWPRDPDLILLAAIGVILLAERSAEHLPFAMATLSEIDLKGFSVEAPEGKGSFSGSLTLHGVRQAVSGAVDVRQAGAALRVKASFPVLLSAYSIAKPRYLGVGVKDIVQVEVDFAISR